ncbi:hypothetical protein A3F05_00745 [Candidatus Saccharibacteria bacterium RIFCSPHIGHO2_12_FULL_47_17]|nr:MAG: hypothetical protein A3F05_00745 [Candidatus Saccharibacteria bacterium RIFCSPHIGHO2_12_FULL_47_17]
MHNDQRGLGHLILILLLLLLAAVGFIGWYVYDKSSSKESKPASQSASSNQSAKWQSAGVAIAGNYADADVVDLGNGKYRLYYSLEPEVTGFNGQVYSALSSDGENWAKEEGTRIEQATFPSVLRLSDGKFRMYYQNAGAIKSAVSSDGLAWTAESGTRVDTANSVGLSLTNVGAPTVAKIGDKYVMVYFGAIGEKYTAAGLVPNNETHPLLWATSDDGLTFAKQGIALDSRNSMFKGWMDGPELVAWEGGENRLYLWGYKGIYYSVFTDNKFSEPQLTFSTATGNQEFPQDPPGDPTLAQINGAWNMYYGQHQKGIYRAVYK